MTRKKATNLAGPLIMGVLLFIGSFFIREKYLALAFIGLSFMAFTYFHPFVGVLGALFAYVFLPDVLSLLCIFGIGGIYLFSGLLQGRSLEKPDNYQRVLYFYFIYMIVSTIFSTYPKGSFRDLAIHTGGLLFFIILLTEGNSKKRLHLMLSVLSLALTIIAVYGIRQYFTGVELLEEWVDVENNPDLKTRIFSVFGNPNIFAEYLVFLTPVTVGLFCSTKSDGKRIFYFCQFLIALMALGLTMSRGGWVGLAGAAAFFIFFQYKRLFLLGIPAAAAGLFLMPEGILRRIFSIFNLADSSTTYRFKIFEITGEVIRDHLFLGVGLGHLPFKRMFETYIRTMPIYHAHNTYLEIMAELGILGFLLFLLLIVTVFFYGGKKILTSEDSFVRINGLALMSGLFGVLVHGMFENILYLTKITMTFWIVVALIFAMGRLQKRTVLEGDMDEKVPTL